MREVKSSSPSVLPTPPGKSESPTNRWTGSPSTSSARAVEPGVWPRREIASRSKPSKLPTSPWATVKSIGTPVASVTVAASASPAPAIAPVASLMAASARVWSVCAWVVKMATSFAPSSPCTSPLPSSSSWRMAGASSAASMRTWAPVSVWVSR